MKRGGQKASPRTLAKPLRLHVWRVMTEYECKARVCEKNRLATNITNSDESTIRVDKTLSLYSKLLTRPSSPAPGQYSNDLYTYLRPYSEII